MSKARFALIASLLAAFLALPAVAAADCTLPSPAGVDEHVDPADEQVYTGNFGPELNGQYVQIPFEVPPGTTGLRIRYCYERPSGMGTTLDLGVYEPTAGGGQDWGMDERRGWSGSAVSVVGIGVNGPTDPATYGSSDGTRKAYVAGRTTRAYQPGPVPAGTWAVELGAGWIDPALTEGTDWRVGVTPSQDPAWSDEPFEPEPYLPYVADSRPGWYQGDLHVHGENEPGNALMSDSFDLAFQDLLAGPLDFITLVDHNNDVARSELGAYEGLYPGKLIIPGTEVTTYDGHFNSQSSNSFVDFRLGPIHRFDDGDGDEHLDPGELTEVRGRQDPSSRFAQIQAAGGWAQINHPTIYRDRPDACRGCAWNYDDARTDFSKVDAIELQTGVAGVPATAPAAMNPFTPLAVEYYEHALSTGAHIAAVASSDDHKATSVASGPFDSILGQGTTVVHAEELSQAGITAAVKAGHTYVKPFGPDAPDVELTGAVPGQPGTTAIPGDSVSGGALELSVTVSGAASSPRPGPYTLEILRNGAAVDSAPVTGDSFTHRFRAEESGRYSFRLERRQDTQPMLEAYSTPVWFTAVPDGGPTPPPGPGPGGEPSNGFRIGKLKLNRKKGTAVLSVRVESPGSVRLSARNVARAGARASRAGQTVKLGVKPKGKLKKALRRRGVARVKAKVTFTPAGGTAASKSKKLTLKQAKRKRR